MAIETRGRALRGGLYKGEDVGEKGRPLLSVSAKEEEGERMRELVSEDYFGRPKLGDPHKHKETNY